MRNIAGGTFVSHPEPCLVTIELEAGHPLGLGVRSFTEMDEHYNIAFDASDAQVFAHSRSAHGVQPAGWIRLDGAGRVCVLTPGHNMAVWQRIEFQRLLQNGLNWLAPRI